MSVFPKTKLIHTISLYAKQVEWRRWKRKKKSTNCCKLSSKKFRIALQKSSNNLTRQTKRKSITFQQPEKELADAFAWLVESANKQQQQKKLKTYRSKSLYKKRFAIKQKVYFLLPFLFPRSGEKFLSGFPWVCVCISISVVTKCRVPWPREFSEFWVQVNKFFLPFAEGWLKGNTTRSRTPSFKSCNNSTASSRVECTHTPNSCKPVNDSLSLFSFGIYNNNIRAFFSRNHSFSLFFLFPCHCP